MQTGQHRGRATRPGKTHLGVAGLSVAELPSGSCERNSSEQRAAHHLGRKIGAPRAVTKRYRTGDGEDARRGVICGGTAPRLKPRLTVCSSSANHLFNAGPSQVSG